jgi:hypothetical protein
VKGQVTFNVSLPSGVTQKQFLADPQVKKGVQKGIATKLGVNHAWVTVVLTAGRRLAAADRRLANANVKVDFTVTVPPGTTGPTSATKIEEALKSNTANSAAEKTSWADNVVTAIKAASGTTYKDITATTKSLAHTPSTGGTSGGTSNETPAASGTVSIARMGMPLVMMALGVAIMAA